MWICGAGIAATLFGDNIFHWIVTAAVSGVGMALLYPTLIAAVGDISHPNWRGSSLGVYRFWRDLGYVVGAFLAGVTADAFGMDAAVLVVAGLTFLSGALVALRASPQRAPDDLPSTLRP
jgi:MFS family permease